MAAISVVALKYDWYHLLIQLFDSFNLIWQWKVSINRFCIGQCELEILHHQTDSSKSIARKYFLFFKDICRYMPKTSMSWKPIWIYLKSQIVRTYVFRVFAVCRCKLSYFWSGPHIAFITFENLNLHTEFIWNLKSYVRMFLEFLQYTDVSWVIFDLGHILLLSLLKIWICTQIFDKRNIY